jgi:hypothetical protein
MTRNRTLVMVLALVGLFALTASSGHAGRPKKLKQLRAEVAGLKAKIAQLESQADFQMRRMAAGGGTPLFPVGGLCADPCAEDSDGDGVNDCEDLCPCDGTNEDGDSDGVPNCADPCPDDATDACIDPCRQDSDGDGVNDCEDPCPWDPSEVKDGDEDGIPDCADPCPEDKDNDCIGPCPLDADGDGTKDCVDPCPWGETSGRPCILVPPTGVNPDGSVGR